MFHTILVPCDGSESSRRALDAAVDVARRTDATIHLVYVVDLSGLSASIDELLGEDEDADLTVEAAGREILGEAEERVRQADVEVERALVHGNAAAELLDYVEDHSIDFVVIGHHSRDKLRRFLQRGVAEQVAQAATVPVLTVPDESTDGGSYETILLATDGQPGSQRATDLAFDLATLYDARLRGLYVLDSKLTRSRSLATILEREREKTFRELRVRATQSGVDFEAETREGRPAEEIIDAADDADLVVLGTRGQPEVDRLLMGSVSSRVLRKSSTPVLTARTVEE